MTPAGSSPTLARAPRAPRVQPAQRVPRVLVAFAAALALAFGLVVVAPDSLPRADAAVPVSPALRGLAEGVDTSKWQHPHGAAVDWKAAAGSGKSFAFIKATEGYGPENDHYTQDVRDARAAGMVIGSYHKARPSMDAARQARAFAETLQAAGGPQLPPVLDIEIDEGRSPAQIVAWTRTFLTETQRLTGRTPIVYTYRYFWITKTGNSTAFTDYPLWIAEYNKPEPTFPLAGGWTEWTFWQRAGDDGTSPGFPSAVDLNVFAGTRSDLQKWVGPVTPGSPQPSAPAPKPAPTPVTPAARDDAGTSEAGGSSLPTRITIPAIPGIRLPAGVTLPMTITLPPELLSGAENLAGGDLLGAALLDSLPAELLKAAEFS